MELGELSGFVIPLAMTRADLGVLYGTLGQMDRGVELVEEARQVAADRNPVAMPMVLVCRAALHLLAGELDEAEAAIAESDVERLPGTSRILVAAQVSLLRGSLALEADDSVRAAGIADETLEWLHAFEARRLVPAVLLLKGRALLLAGESVEAEAAFLDARSEAKRLGFRIDPVADRRGTKRHLGYGG